MLLKFSDLINELDKNQFLLMVMGLHHRNVMLAKNELVKHEIIRRVATDRQVGGSLGPLREIYKPCKISEMPRPQNPMVVG